MADWKAIHVLEEEEEAEEEHALSPLSILSRFFFRMFSGGDASVRNLMDATEDEMSLKGR